MPPLSVMFKTVSTDCNLDCAYCYYRESLEGTRVRRRIDPRLLETFVPQYMAYVADSRAASFAWQGGEPTLAGLPFFERVVALQAAHARPGTTIANALQTNGLLLDDDWGAFLKRYNFLVGISLDGPQPIHDQQRRAKSGRGSFDLVMRGVDVLRRHGVDFNVLCVLGPHNVDRPRELMAFFREQRFSHVQFIPCMDFQAMEPEKPPAFQITPAQYGAFLAAAFDEWHQGRQPTAVWRSLPSCSRPPRRPAQAWKRYERAASGAPQQSRCFLPEPQGQKSLRRLARCGSRCRRWTYRWRRWTRVPSSRRRASAWPNSCL